MAYKSSAQVQSCRFSALLRVTGWFLPAGCFGLALAGCGGVYHSHPFQREERVTLSAPLPAEKLLVRNCFGDVIVHADDVVGKIQAEIVKTGKGVTMSEAEAALAEIEVSLAPKDGAPGTVVASARHPKGSYRRHYEVQWRIIAPPDVSIDVLSNFGDVKACGFHRGAVLKSDFGDLQAEAAGRIELETDFGDIEVHLLPENPDDVTAYTDFGDVVVRWPSNRKGRLVTGTDFGSLDLGLEGMTMRRVRHRGRYFDAELGGSSEPRTELTTDFGDVSIRRYDVISPATTGP